MPVTITVNDITYNITDAQPNPFVTGKNYTVMDYAIFYAESESLLPVVRQLLGRGVSANRQIPQALSGYQAMSYLMYALTNNYADLAKLLIENDANVNQCFSGPTCGATYYADRTRAWGSYTTLGIVKYYDKEGNDKDGMACALIRKGLNPRTLALVTESTPAYSPLPFSFSSVLVELADAYKAQRKFLSAVQYYYLAAAAGCDDVAEEINELIEQHLTSVQILVIAMRMTASEDKCYIYNENDKRYILYSSRIVEVPQLPNKLDWYGIAKERSTGIRKAIAELCLEHSDVGEFDFAIKAKETETRYHLPSIVECIVDGVYCLNYDIIDTSSDLVYYYLALMHKDAIKAAEYLDCSNYQADNYVKAEIYYNAGMRYRAISRPTPGSEIEEIKNFYKSKQNAHLPHASACLNELLINISHANALLLAKFILSQGDQENAYVYFEIAANVHGEASYYCGQYHMQHFVSTRAPYDPVKAALYYKRALSRRYPEAQNAINQLFLNRDLANNEIINISKMFFEFQAYQEAKRWFVRAGSRAFAKYHLGQYSWQGLAATPINLLEAAQYFLSALLLENNANDIHPLARTALITLMNGFDIATITALFNQFMIEGRQILDELEPQLSMPTRASVVMLRGNHAEATESYAVAVNYYLQVIAMPGLNLNNLALNAARARYNELFILQLPVATLLNIARELFNNNFKASAWSWLTRANEVAVRNEAEEAELHYIRGRYYHFGYQPINVDKEQAVLAYARAIRLNHDAARIEIENIKSDVNIAPSQLTALGTLLLENHYLELANLFYQRAIALNDGEASWCVAVCLNEALSIETIADYPKVVRHYKKAIENGYHLARNSLDLLEESFAQHTIAVAEIYEAQGDIAEADRWYCKGIAQHLGAASWRRGSLLARTLDLTTPEAYWEVFTCYQQAINDGYEDARASLTNLIAQALAQLQNRITQVADVPASKFKFIGSLYSDDGELEQAKPWFQRAAQLQDGAACFWMGDYYYTQMLPNEPLTAIQYYISALQYRYDYNETKIKIDRLLSENLFNTETKLSIAKLMQRANLHKIAKPLLECALDQNLAEAYLHYGNYINPDYVMEPVGEQIAEESADEVYIKNRHLAGIAYCRGALGNHHGAKEAFFAFINNPNISDETLEAILSFLEDENPTWLSTHRDAINEQQYAKINLVLGEMLLNQSQSKDICTRALVCILQAANQLPQEANNKLLQLYDTLNEPAILRYIGEFYANPQAHPSLLQSQYNPDEANRWLMRADEKENNLTVADMLRLGDNRFGMGASNLENYTLAFNWYVKALEKAKVDPNDNEMRHAAYMQGKCYENGYGAVINLYQAGQSYIAAYQYGLQTASEDIGRIQANPQLTKREAKLLERHLLAAQAHLAPRNFLNIKDTQGKTALHRAAKKSYKDFARLVFLGSDHTIQDNEGNTAFSYIENQAKAIKSYRKFKSSFNQLQKKPCELLKSVVECDNSRKREAFEAIIEGVGNNEYLKPFLNFAKLYIIKNAKNHEDQLSIIVSSQSAYTLFNNGEPIYKLKKHKIAIYYAPESFDQFNVVKELMGMIALMIIKDIFNNDGLPYQGDNESPLINIKNTVCDRLGGVSPSIRALLNDCFLARADMKQVIPSIIKYITDSPFNVNALMDELPELWAYFTETFLSAVNNCAAQMQQDILNGYDKEWLEEVVKNNAALLEDNTPELTLNCRIS